MDFKYSNNVCVNIKGPYQSFSLFSYGKTFISVAVKVRKAAILLFRMLVQYLVKWMHHWFKEHKWPTLPLKRIPMQGHLLKNSLHLKTTHNLEMHKLCFQEWTISEFHQIDNGKLRFFAKNEQNICIFVMLIKHVQNKYSNEWHLSAIKL